MKLTKYEQETIINFNNDEQEASIYTASPQMMRKLDALAAAYPEHYQVVLNLFHVHSRSPAIWFSIFLNFRIFTDSFLPDTELSPLWCGSFTNSPHFYGGSFSASSALPIGCVPHSAFSVSED